jgi:glycerol-3-phosphate dehydrogenase (NAD(P)+)
LAKIAILGAGMMGSALSIPLVDAGHQVTLVGTPLDTEIIAALRAQKPHPGLDVPLPGVVVRHWQAAPEESAEADGVVVGVSSAGIDFVARAVRELAIGVRPIALLTKGLRWQDGTLLTMPDIVAAGAANTSLEPAGICGPCIAGELARRVPTSVVVAGRDAGVVGQWVTWLRTSYYRACPNPDLVGAQICAALKNAYAMGLSLAQGLHERRGGSAGKLALHNYEAAMFAQALAEMRTLVALCGGDTETVAGLAGAGDLLVTLNGGRTSHLGRWLGLGIGRTEAIRRMRGATLEALEILDVLRAALADLVAAGKLASDALPLLRHLMEVALDDGEVTTPLERFFGS